MPGKMGASARLLEVLETFRINCRDPSLPGLVIFLHVCENDGISIKDLVFHSGYSESLVSRAVDRLRSTDEPGMPGPAGGLFRVTKHPQDGRRRQVFLSEPGRRLQAELFRILGQDVSRDASRYG